MTITEKEITLKNGQKIILRSPMESEAKAVSDHRYETSKETYFMSCYPEESKFREAEMKERMTAINEDEKAFNITAYADGKIVGDAVVSKIKNHIKFRHRGYFGISIRDAYCDLGLGSIMLNEAIKIAKENGFEQLELGVFSDNHRAIHVYEKAGFKKVGVQPRAFKLKDGTYRDEVLMVLMFVDEN